MRYSFSRFLATFSLSLLLSTSLLAQEEIVVKGRVVDEKGETLPSVTVVIKGTSQGVISDIEGNFLIRTSDRDAVVQVSFIGYKAKEYKVGDFLSRMKDGVITLNIQLQPESKQLEEVVVSGYRDLNKRLFPGAATTISGDEVRQAAASGIDEMLQGKVAGLQIQNVTGAPGARTKIRIRGTASLTGNAEPLWVIDGVVLADPVPIDPNQLYSGDPSNLLSSAIGGLNPNDVESITVLRDATATAIYGSRAVNGVIVVTTKRGRAGKTQIDYTNNLTTAIRPRAVEFDFMNSQERLDFSLELYRKDLINDFSLSNNSGALGQLLAHYTDKRIDLEDFRQRLSDIEAVNTDWFGVLFRNSFSQEHNVSLSTGSEKHTLYISFNYFDQNASVITNDLLRYTGSAASTFQLSKWWSIELKLDAIVRQADSFNVPSLRNLGGNLIGQYITLNNPYIAARTMNRAMYLRDNQGNLIYYNRGREPFNVLEEMENTRVDVEAREIRGLVTMNFDITKDLRLKNLASIRRTYNHRDEIIKEQSNILQVYRNQEDTYYNPVDDRNNVAYPTLPFGGILGYVDDEGSFLIARNSLEWKPTRGYHDYEAIVGTELLESVYDQYRTTGYGIGFDRLNTVSTDLISLQAFQGDYFSYSNRLERSFSLYGVFAYAYKKRYTASLQARNDVSNSYGQSRRFRVAPNVSLGLGWIMKEEPWLKDSYFFHDLKWILGVGQSGNVSGFFSPTVLAFPYVSRDVLVFYNRSDRAEALGITHPPNPNLRRELTNELNTGFNSSFLKGRLDVLLNYYYRLHDDLVARRPVSYVSGFNRLNVNWGRMENQGVELTLRTKNIQMERFTWGTQFTATYNRNRVLEVEGLTTRGRAISPSAATLAIPGKPLRPLYSVKYANLDKRGIPLFYDENGEKKLAIDLNSDDLDILNYHGPQDPILDGGLINNFSFGKFDLSFMFVYTAGRAVRLADVYQIRLR